MHYSMLEMIAGSSDNVNCPIGLIDSEIGEFVDRLRN